LHDKIQIAKAVNVTVISLEDAPKGYKDFGQRRGQEICDRPARHDRGRDRSTGILP